jgi:CotH kinase protein/Lamin Tail Domain/Secretion system C-terminal sorting domain
MKLKTTLYSILLFCALFSGNRSYSQYIFDPTIVHDIQIDFYQSNWDFLLDSMASAISGTGSGTGRILADVTIDGTLYDSCGVRYKGNSSMDTTSNKNPFNIDLNYVILGQEHQGKDKIKLANCFADPSMIREVLMYELSNQYMDCPKANFTKLYINGDYRGIYTNTESIDNEFLKEFYGSSSNSFFKCDPNSFDIFGDNSNLAYQLDSMAYDTLYDKKSPFGLAELQALTFELEFNPSTIENFLDVDRALWFLAVSSAFVHNDGYTAFAHNFYIYKMDNGKWSIILWDANMAFGGLPWNGTGVLPLSSNAMETQDPFLHIGAPNFRPLIAQILSIPKFQKMYVAHMRTIMSENVANNYFMQRAQYWHDQIDPDVPSEPYPFYTYQDFLDNMTQDYGFFFELRAGIQSLMQARETYLNSLAPFQISQPSITNIIAPLDPNPYTTISITADFNNETEAWLGYRHNQYDAFTRVQMFDDGLNNDGAASDGTYGVSVTLQSLEMQYYFYAENAGASIFSPVRAEYEFYTLTPKKGLVINELSALNVSIMADQALEYDDWIELYNNTTNPIVLSDYFLSDDGGNLYKWLLPNITLQADSYIVFWADNQAGQGIDHASFQLSSTGETLYLTHLTDSIVDMVSFPEQYVDITYGRLPNGTGPFDYLYPTFSAENSTAVSLEETPDISVDLKLYPNPTTTFINIETDVEMYAQLYLYNLNGQVVLEDVFNGVFKTLDLAHLPKGTYILKMGDNLSKRIVIS